MDFNNNNANNFPDEVWDKMMKSLLNQEIKQKIYTGTHFFIKRYVRIFC